MVPLKFLTISLVMITFHTVPLEVSIPSHFRQKEDGRLSTRHISSVSCAGSYLPRGWSFVVVVSLLVSTQCRLVSTLHLLREPEKSYRTQILTANMIGKLRHPLVRRQVYSSCEQYIYAEKTRVVCIKNYLPRHICCVLIFV